MAGGSVYPPTGSPLREESGFDASPVHRRMLAGLAPRVCIRSTLFAVGVVEDLSSLGA